MKKIFAEGMLRKFIDARERGAPAEELRTIQASCGNMRRGNSKSRSVGRNAVDIERFLEARSLVAEAKARCAAVSDDLPQTRERRVAEVQRLLASIGRFAP